MMATPKARLKDLANGRPLGKLLAMAPNNDPFNSGSLADVANAQWFATQVFAPFGGPGAHLRRLHYKVANHNIPVLKPDGSRYLNTEEDWQYLQDAAKHARYQGLVRALDLVDRRNPEPHLFAPDPCEPPQPRWIIDEFYGFTLPSISTYFYTDFDVPETSVSGYDYHAGEQPFLLEIWIEKSTMNAELLPLCERYGVNLVTAAEFQSITGAVQCLSRVPHAAHRLRPVRVFYISDYDPAGQSMPRAVARQFEFWLQEAGRGADLKLTPIALTRQQVEQYDLPRIPIKEKDVRRGAFEAIHGEGAVELDALEGLYPGSLVGIVEQHILNYRDVNLPQRLTVAERRATQEGLPPAAA